MTCAGVVKVSILIPCWNQADFTAACIRALTANTPESINYEVVLVDNGSTDRTPELLSGLGSRFRVIRNEKNLGFARACNQGAQAARGEYLLFLNNDTEPHPGWLEPLVAALDGDPRIGAAGSLLLFPDGKVQHAGVGILTNAVPTQWMRGADPEENPSVFQSRELQAVTAACILVRGSAFVGCGGFDEAFVNGCEDVDLCLKLRSAGWKVLYEPRSVLTHAEGMSEGRQDKDRENALFFVNRWAARAVPDMPRFVRLAKGVAPRLSYVLTTSDDIATIDGCLARMLASLSPDDEVVVVDRLSSDGTVEVLLTWAQTDPRVLVLGILEPEGRELSLDKALRQATGDLFVVVKSSAAIGPDWLASMEALLSERVGAVSADEAGAKDPDLEGACVMIPRRVLEQVGLFGPDPISGIPHLRDRLLAAQFEIASAGLIVDTRVEPDLNSQIVENIAIAGLKRSNLLLDARWDGPAEAWLPAVEVFARTFKAADPVTMVVAGATDAALERIAGILEPLGDAAPDILSVDARYESTAGLIKLCQGVVAAHAGRAAEIRHMARLLGKPVLESPDRKALQTWAQLASTALAP